MVLLEAHETLQHLHAGVPVVVLDARPNAGDPRHGLPTDAEVNLAEMILDVSQSAAELKPQRVNAGHNPSLPVHMDQHTCHVTPDPRQKSFAFLRFHVWPIGHTWVRRAAFASGCGRA